MNATTVPSVSSAPAGVRGAGAAGVSGLHRFMLLLGWPLRLGLGGLFLWAAFNKLKPPNGPQLFSDSVRAFKVPMPDALVRISTGGVPWVEAVAGVCLIVGFWLRGAAAVLAALLVAFIALIVQALARGLNVKCGCFGDLSPFCKGEIGVCHLVQNSVMLVAALIIMLTPRVVKVGKLTPADLRR